MNYGNENDMMNIINNNYEAINISTQVYKYNWMAKYEMTLRFTDEHVIDITKLVDRFKKQLTIPGIDYNCQRIVKYYAHKTHFCTFEPIYNKKQIVHYKLKEGDHIEWCYVENSMAFRIAFKVLKKTDKTLKIRLFKSSGFFKKSIERELINVNRTQLNQKRRELTTQ